MKAHVVAVSVGRPEPVMRNGQRRMTAIRKAPVSGRVAVRGVNVDGDSQADAEHHGGPEQAVYAYAREDYEWWEGELGRALEPGTFGENLTLAGIDVSGALVGERWRIGTVTLEVTHPRIPCWKFEQRMELPGWIARFGDAARFGAYLRIAEEGELAAGDPVEVSSRPDGGTSVRAIGQAKMGKMRAKARA